MLSPHSTCTLQPLDVVMSKPFLLAYLRELTKHTHTQEPGKLSIKGGDSFVLFWMAWVISLTEQTTLESFKATGILPMDTKNTLRYAARP